MATKNQIKWISFSVLLGILFGAVSIVAIADMLHQTPAATLVPFVTPTKQPICPPTCNHILAATSSDFIVKLKIDNYKSETKLNASQIQLQREKIRQIQSDLQELIRSKRQPYSYDRVRFFFEATPYMLVHVNAEILRVLTENKNVEAVYIFSLLNEVFDMGLENAVIDLEAVYGKPLAPFITPTQKCAILTCDDMLRKAQRQGFIELFVVLKLERQPEYANLGSADFERTQAALIYRANIAFLKKFVPNLISADSTFLWFNGLLIKLLPDGFNQLIAMPEIAYVADLNELKFTQNGKTLP